MERIEKQIHDAFSENARSISCHRDALLQKLKTYNDDKLCLLDSETQHDTLDSLLSEIRTALEVREKSFAAIFEEAIEASNNRNGNKSLPTVSVYPRVESTAPAEEEATGPRIIKGELMKKSPRSYVGWQSRFCKIDKHGVFSYYFDEAEAIGKPKGSFKLSDVDSSKRGVTDILKGSCVSIQVGARLFEFQAGTIPIAVDWVNAITSHFPKN